MKLEHKAIIERAQRMGTLPSMLAHELLLHDLVSACIFELRNIKAPVHKLSQEDQQEVIDRITEEAREGVSTAVAIINSRGAITVPCTVKSIKVDPKSLTVTSLVDAKDPNRHGLTDSAGSLCLLVMAPDDYDEGLDGIRADRDQFDMPLSINERLDQLDLSPGKEQEQGQDEQRLDIEGDDPLYKAAVAMLVSYKRLGSSALQGELKIGFNRAQKMLDQMVADGSATQLEGTAVYLSTADVVDAEFTPPVNGFDQFGEHSYEDAKQIIVLHGDIIDAAWLQRRLLIDSEMATSLLLRLLEDQVIQLEAEAPDRIDYTYKVTASLADVVGVDA